MSTVSIPFKCKNETNRWENSDRSKPIAMIVRPDVTAVWVDAETRTCSRLARGGCCNWIAVTLLGIRDSERGACSKALTIDHLYTARWPGRLRSLGDQGAMIFENCLYLLQLIGHSRMQRDTRTQRVGTSYPRRLQRGVQAQSNWAVGQISQPWLKCPK